MDCKGTFVSKSPGLALSALPMATMNAAGQIILPLTRICILQVMVPCAMKMDFTGSPAGWMMY